MQSRLTWQGPWAVLSLAAILGAAMAGWAARRVPVFGYSDTPLLPGGPWHVHDGQRPQPRVVTPGETAAAAPSDAVVLFGGQNLDAWAADKGQGPAPWVVENGYFEVAPGKGGIHTKEAFGDLQLHLEFCEPDPPKGGDQGRGNSGVILMGRYEIQVLDGYQNPTYADGLTGAVYGQAPPLVNACRPPGQWQTYDIIWNAPQFAAGKVTQPAFVTVLLNGVLLHHHREVLGSTRHKQLAKYDVHPPTGPLALQDHGQKIRFRNVWARRLDEPAAAASQP